MAVTPVLGLSSRVEAEVLLEVEREEIDSWVKAPGGIQMCKPDFPSFLGMSLEALSIGE